MTAMRQLHDRLSGDAGRQRLIVFLPGAFDAPEKFFAHGFVAALRGHNVAADIAAIESHPEDIHDSSIALRLRDEVIRPARASGYRSIWLVGISLGGLAAMLCAARHGEIDGVVALAPYVGTREVIAEVRNAGGLQHWRPAISPADSDWERQMLVWLKQGSHRTPRGPELVFAYGRQDRFADSLDLIAEGLPSQRVLTAQGGHDWDTWGRLWTATLDRYGSLLGASQVERLR
jgi:pimeloyl-ACP methyl ester carboxylesterase